MKNSQNAKREISGARSAGVSDAGRAIGHNVPTLWRAILGFIIWAAGFVALYVVHALGCRYLGIGPELASGSAGSLSALTVLLAVIWLGFVAWILWGARKSWINMKAAASTDQDKGKLARFMPTVTLTVDVVSAIAMFVTGIPILLTPACM